MTTPATIAAATPPTATTTPMFGPDGSLGDIPSERVNDAVKAGFKIGQDLLSPDGRTGTVPLDSVHAALQKGFKLKSTAPLSEAEASANPNLAANQASSQSMNLPAKEIGHVRFLASDGTVHDVAAEHLPQAKQIDPTLKVIDAAGGASDPDAYDKVANVVQGAKDSAVGKLAKDVTTPPASVDEHVAMLTLGPGGLPLYRQAKALVDGAKNVVKATGEAYPKAIQDFKRMVDDFKSGNYRQGASSAVSTASDAAGIADPTLTPLTTQTRELAEGARPGGNLATPLTRQVLDAGTAAVGGPKRGEVAGDVVEAGGKLAEGANDAAGRAASRIKTAELRPEQLVKRPETPEPQHGTPVKVETPLDSASISKSLGGKNLSNDAVKTLQSHVGEKIPVGSTPKTQALAAAEPVQNLISETSSKMNRIVRDAPQFTTNIETDAGFGNNNLTSEIEAIKKNLPASEKLKLSQDADAVLEDASEILKSTDPAKVVEYRRQLGNSIDWENVSKNPETPKEVQNATRAKVYRAITDKIHSEVPETAPLDKVMQPHLELRSHLRNRLGDRAFEDVHAATAESQEQAKLGKQKIDNDLHNEQVAKNWRRVKDALLIAGVGKVALKELFGE
jgi:hypothetical protein